MARKPSGDTIKRTTSSDRVSTVRDPAPKTEEPTGLRTSTAAAPVAVSAVGADQLRALRMEGSDLAALHLFAARIGNELNNPLAAVLAAHQYVRRRVAAEGGSLAGDPRLRTFMDLIEAELASAVRIVGDLLAFGAVRPVLRSCFLLRDLVEEAIGRVRRNADVTIEDRVPEATVPVHLDRDMMARVLTQLVQNGADAVASGGAGLITIDGSADREEVKLVVRDNGAGISQEVQHTMWQPLISTKAKGSGLGLPIAEALVRAQGGTITCESTLGQGATFTLRLPNG